MPTDLARQITQFHARYPFGSLTSELLRVHNDTYLIRAIAQVGSTVVATAMGAHSDLEQAEDRAKARVLETLTLSATAAQQPSDLAPAPELDPVSPAGLTRPAAPAIAEPSSPPPLPLAEPFPSSAAIPSTDYPPQLQLPSPDRASLEENLAQASPKASPSSEKSRLPPTDSLPPIDETIPGLDQPLASASKSLPKKPMPSQPKPSQETTQPHLTLAPPQQPQLDPKETLTPKDLSDIIAKTSVELRRLGWNDEQGREHLQSSYGKRSRQQLTDPELVDFLRYLEQQPAPPPA